MRALLATHKDLAAKIEKIEQKYDGNFFMTNKKIIAAICFLVGLFFAPPTIHARIEVPNFSQPYTIDFNNPQSYQNQILWQEPAILTITHEQVGCYEGGCVKFRIHDFAGEDSAGLSDIWWPPTDRVNIGMLVKYGPDYEAKLDVEGYKFMVVHETFEDIPEWQPNTAYSAGDMVVPTEYPNWTHYYAVQGGVSGSSEPAWPTERNNPTSDGSVIWDVRTLIRPMISDAPVTNPQTPGITWYRTLKSCNIAGGVCRDEFGQQYFNGNEGRHTFKIGEHIGEWVWLEFEIVRGGNNTLYIYTADGSLAGQYATIENVNLLPLRHINEISYWEGASNTTEGTYIMFDQLKIHNQFIGPPAGFGGGLDAIAPAAPAGLVVQ